MGFFGFFRRRLHLTIAALAQKTCLYIMKLPVSLMLKAVALTIMHTLSSPIRDIEMGWWLNRAERGLKLA